MIDPDDTRTLPLPLRRYASEPAWLCDAAAACPCEADVMARCTADLQALPRDVAMPVFVAAYERMLNARDVLYQAWISRQMDDPA